MPSIPLEISAAPSRRHDFASRSASAFLLRAVGGTCLVGLLVVAVVLASRRASGVLSAPLAAMPMLVAGMLVATLTVLAQCRHARRIAAARNREITPVDVAALGAPAAVAVFIAAVISLPGTQLAPAALLWSPLLAGQAALVWLHRPRATAADTEPAFDEPRGPLPADATAAATAPVARMAGTFDDTGEDQLAENATQQWTRRTVDGADVLEGLARAVFAAGARAANLHVAICPPFAGAAEVFAEAIDGPEATVTVAEVLPFGVRLDVRLVDACDEDTSVVVAVVARS